LLLRTFFAGGTTDMMGIKDRSFSALPHNISLEELVPKENFYRRLQSMLDLSFVRELVRPSYAGVGRPSVDPVVFFKLQLVMFFEDLRSERQLMSVVADRLSLRWYLGYDLCEPLPDHSSLTRIRERYGLEVFRRFFERIVEMCFEAGLVRGHELYFDATKVEANASLDSTRSRSLVENRLEGHLASIFPEQAPPVEGLAQEAKVRGLAGVVGPTDPQEWEALAKTNARRHRWIAEAGGQERGVVRWGYRRMADLRVSTTDPDASPMRSKKESASRLGYLTHYVVDGGKARVILDVLVTPAEVTENLPMVELLFKNRFRWRLRLRSVTGDGAYGTKGNIAAIEKAGIRAYTALPDHEKRTSLFGRDAFTYDAEKDIYTCPQGELLRRQGYDYREREVHKVRREALRLQRVCLQSQVHHEHKGALDKARLRGGVSRKGAGLPRYGTLPQGHKETRGMGRASVRRSQGLAWVQKVPAKDIREGKRRGLAHRCGTEHKEATHLRLRGSEATGTDGRPAPAGSLSMRVVWHSAASQECSRCPARVFQQAEPFHALG
jgi:transposase